MIFPNFLPALMVDVPIYTENMSPNDAVWDLVIVIIRSVF